MTELIQSFARLIDTQLIQFYTKENNTPSKRNPFKFSESQLNTYSCNTKVSSNPKDKIINYYNVLQTAACFSFNLTRRKSSKIINSNLNVFD